MGAYGRALFSGIATMLSDSESDVGSPDIQLTVNEHFAKAYAAKKEREELDKLKEKYGSDPEGDGTDEEDSEEAESEDEDGEELTPAVDAAILRTLAKIKRKDPDIYEKDRSIFEQEQERTGRTILARSSTKEHSKPLTIKQHALSSILHANATSRTPSPVPQIITHDQEQSKLRSETVSAFHQAVDENDDDGIFILREKTKDDVEREEEDYQEYLRKEVGEDIRDLISIDEANPTRVEDSSGGEGGEAAPKAKKPKLNKGKEKQKPETDQEFLMNYILNRGWIDRAAKRVPTYQEITNVDTMVPFDAALNSAVPDEMGQEDSLIEDNEFEDFVDRFESSYNFRFEEPDAAVIPTHPRNLPSVVRRQDTTRKEARERRKQRKQEELAIKKEEVKLMKALKMKELRQKLERIGREGGVEIDTGGLLDLDLDGDWDPEKHDRQMTGLYNDEEYEEEVEKPQWNDEINIDEILPNLADSSKAKPIKKKQKKHKSEVDIPDGVDVDAMDAEVAGKLEEEWDGTEEMRKRKVQEYMDEVYGMDFNDMVGDLPTHFNYTSVTPQSYALTPVEILLATDAELNEYVGIKQIAPYRRDGRWDAKRSNRLRDFKTKVTGRSWVPGQTDAEGVEGKKTKKRKGKKERQRAKDMGDGVAEEIPGEDEQTEHSFQGPAKRRRKD